jgi:uncharacterized protein YjiS (DUF1127 family)
MSIQTYRSNTRSAGTATLGLIAQSITVALQEWWERNRQRRSLGRLDDRLLKDIGLSRADVEHELSKPFWQA